MVSMIQLVEAAGIKGTLEFAGIPVVLGKGAGKAVSAVHFRAGAEKEVAVTVRVQDCLKAGFVRHADRSRRKTVIAVGVVRRVIFQMLEQHPVKLIVKAIGHCRISLEPYSLVKTVKIDPRNGRILRFVV